MIISLSLSLQRLGHVVLRSDPRAFVNYKNWGASPITFWHQYGCNTSLSFSAGLQGNGNLLFLGSNSMHFWLCHYRWNSIPFYQDLEEGVWKDNNSANQKTKKDLVEIWKNCGWKWRRIVLLNGKFYYPLIKRQYRVRSPRYEQNSSIMKPTTLSELIKHSIYTTNLFKEYRNQGVHE